MIRITEQHNIKCLKCLVTPEKLVRIGVYYMCDDCFDEEFDDFLEVISFDGQTHHGIGIDPKGKGSKTYHKWLQVYLERSEDEYYETQ